MPIIFKCKNCHSELIINFLQPGEIAVCNSCSEKNIVPGENRKSYIRHSYFGNSLRVIKEEKKILTEYENLIFIITRICLGVLLYLIPFNFVMYPMLIQTSLIGHIFVFTALMRLHNMNLIGFWIYAAMVFCGIHILSKTGAIFGLATVFTVDFILAELLLLMIVLYKLSTRYQFLNEFIRSLRIVIVIFIFEVLLLFVFMLSTPFLIYLNKFLARIDFYLYLVGQFGIMLPLTILNISANIITIYLAISIYRHIKKLKPEVFEQEQINN